MNGDGICRNQLIEISKIVRDIATIHLDHQLLFDQVEVFNMAEISIEDIFVVVISNLHDPIAHPVGSAVPLEAGAGWIQCSLQLPIEIFRAANALVHRR